jgi:hypothetical protein
MIPQFAPRRRQLGLGANLGFLAYHRKSKPALIAV